MPMKDSPCTIAATASWSSELTRASSTPGTETSSSHGSPRPLLNHFPKEGKPSTRTIRTLSITLPSHDEVQGSS
ncbi:unnamed protein product [Linum trigynum]|uniref:Uncharacterized protein n=1 Tax=Linum trigynum TaxID=586398 RepID=A0AAV2E883_9ROSI